MILNNNKWIWILVFWYQERNTDYSYTTDELGKFCLILHDNAKSGEPEKTEDKNCSKEGTLTDNIWENLD